MLHPQPSVIPPPPVLRGEFMYQEEEHGQHTQPIIIRF